jgi:hypothetical protein
MLYLSCKFDGSILEQVNKPLCQIQTVFFATTYCNQRVFDQT